MSLPLEHLKNSAGDEQASICGDEKVLELGGGEGCTTV